MQQWWRGRPSAALAPAPAAPAVAAPLSFQPENTTVAYQAASATALVTNAGVGGVATAASGQGATITVTTSGGAYTVVFNIPTTGTTFTQQFSEGAFDYGGPIGPLPNTAQFAAMLSQIFGFPNTNGAVITQSVGRNHSITRPMDFGRPAIPPLPVALGHLHSAT